MNARQPSSSKHSVESSQSPGGGSSSTQRLQLALWPAKFEPQVPQVGWWQRSSWHAIKFFADRGARPALAKQP